MKRLTVKETADRLSISEQAVRELVKRGNFGKAVGGKNERKTYLIYEELVKKWLEQ